MPGRARPFLERLAFRTALAAAEAVFPENTLDNGAPAPSAREARVLERLDEYLSAVPEETRRLILLLFLAVELSPKLYFPLARRFSRLPGTRREAHLRRLRASSIYPLRLIGDALKGILTMMYLSDPGALRYLGAYTVSPRPGDASLEARPDALLVQLRRRGAQ